MEGGDVTRNDLADSINEEGGPKNNNNNETKRVIKSFEQRIEDLRAYKAKHGHTNVKEKEDKSLYEFCKNMRRARKHQEKYRTLINEERIASMDALGFDWGVKEQAIKSFEHRIKDLQLYREKNGHVNVKGSEDMSLYNFCKHMRNNRNNPGKSSLIINNDRIASLDAIGFNWKMKERQAGKSAAKQTNLQVPECNNMRHARKHPGKSTLALTDDRIASLDALGFAWSAHPSKSDKPIVGVFEVPKEVNVSYNC